MKTTVQTLIENLYNHEHHIDILDVAQLNGYFEQALKAEKEQIEALEKHIKEMKLYAFQPQGHGEQSFFTIAKSEEEAIKALNLNRMTREKFIKKWLGNKDYQYTEENRDLMRDDLDKVINQALRQPLVISSVCTCTNAQLEKDSLVPVYCHNCNAYVQTDL